MATTTTSSIIAARQAAMHMSATLMVRGIRAALKNGSDIREQEAAADGLAMWAEAIPGMFPAGSDAPISRALPAVWANKADFDQRAAEYRQAALLLRDLARAGDRTAFAAQVEVVQSKCTVCHERYRAP
jgi:cytochrome c556